jgi:hypothetical protein
MAGGRPSKYTKEIADTICELTATTTKGIRSIAEEAGVGVRTIFDWLHSNEEFAQQYARAKEEQADLMVETIIEVAFDGSRDDTPFTGSNHVQRDRLKVDALKWIASKLKPKKYGDKLDVEHSGKIITVEIQED